MNRGMWQGLALGVVLLASTSVPGIAATATRVSAFEYDAVSGLLTKEIVEPDQTQFRLETLYAYDAFGNKLTATVSSPATGQAAIISRTNSNSYDASGRFATSSANALNHTETRSFDARFGAVVSLTGPNAITTTWEYDDLGRKAKETRADGTQTKLEYLYCNGVAGGTASCPTLAKYLVKTTPFAADGTTQNGPWSKTYFDVLGREIQGETQGFDGTSIAIVATQYDTKGRVAKKTRPLFGTSGSTPTWASGTYTSFTYDAINRPTVETYPDSSTSQFAYDGLTSVATNALSQTKTTIKNSQGQVVQVKDTQNNTTTFAYDPFGNLVSTTDAAANVTTATYDIRGRKTAMSDPDMGAWSYVYNVLGELVQQTDAKSQVSTIVYDKLGRVTSRVESGLTSTWAYDTATKGVGKLASASASNGYLRTQYYDSLGRPWRTQRWIDQLTTDPGYTSDTSYDAQGRPQVLTYPSGFELHYVYTALGYLSEVRKTSAVGDLLWQANAMDAEGHITQHTHGNGVVTNHSFDAPTGRLTGITAGPTATPSSVQNMSFVWDTISNLSSRTDATQNLQENFTYDSLNRLTGSSVVDVPSLAKTIQYNAIGNITYKSDVGTYIYNASGSSSVRPHAVASISGTLNTSFTYDANGNMLTGSGRTITYTSFNMPATIARGATTISFDYDSEHARTKQVAPDGTTVYLGPSTGHHAEKLIGTGGAVRWTNYIHAAGGMVAAFYEQVGATPATMLRYFHKDHLGSISVITNEAGAVTERLSYDAWGKRRHPTGTDDAGETITSGTDRGFTGHEHLEYVGLIHMNGRVYDPTIARFLTADPMIQDPTDTQSLNRYTYVLNNPLAYTDPSGFFFKKLFKAIKSVFKAIKSNPIVRAVVVIAATVTMQLYVMPAILAGTAFAGTTAGALITAGVSGGVGGYVATGTLRGAAIGAITALAMYGVGSATDAHFGADPKAAAAFEGTWKHGANIAGHAAVGCASAEAGGGKCGPGALSGAFGAAIAPRAFAVNDFAARAAITAVAGGVGSVLGGGKFQNGVITSAFGYLFNHGAGFVIGGVAEAGMGAGATAQASAGGGWFLSTDDWELTSGLYAAGGAAAFVPDPNFGNTRPESVVPPIVGGNGVIGAYAGTGYGFFLTNANNSAGLTGAGTTYSLNIPFVSGQFSIDSNRTWLATVTFRLPALGLSISQVPTYTQGTAPIRNRYPWP